MDSIVNMTEYIQHQVSENTEEFIFTTIKSYCDEITQQKISKQDLKEALELWMSAKKILHK